jgi:flavodoxin
MLYTVEINRKDIKMLIKVMFHSNTGNTEKVAVSIATATGIRAEAIFDNTVVKSADLLFIGTGANDKKPDDTVKNFIEKLDASKIKFVAVFGTYHSNKDAILQMKDALNKKGIKVFDEIFGCKGAHGVFFNSGHPDDKDLNSAIQFANRAIASAKTNV